MNLYILIKIHSVHIIMVLCNLNHLMIINKQSSLLKYLKPLQGFDMIFNINKFHVFTILLLFIVIIQ